MNRKFLWLLAAWLAIPGVAWGAAGEPCTVTAPSGLRTDKQCKLICDVVAVDGAVVCGPIWITGGGANLESATISFLSGTSGGGCGYDDFVIYGTDSATVSASLEKTQLVVLDDDGTSTPTGGVKSHTWYGDMPFAYLYVTGVTSGTCSTSSRAQLRLVTDPKD